MHKLVVSMLEKLDKEEALFEERVLEGLKAAVDELASYTKDEIIDFVWAYFQEGKKLGKGGPDKLLLELIKSDSWVN